MRATGYEAASVWDIARPARRCRVPGIAVAGFRHAGAGPIALPVIPNPSVTLVVEFGQGSLLVGDEARQQRGSLVAGLAPGAMCMRGNGFECVEVRLSPVVARAVLGTSAADLGRAVVGLDDLWGREAVRIRERLDGMSLWDSRFAALDELLTDRVATGPTMDREVVWVWQRILRSGGLVRVEELADELGWSRRRLWGRFRSEVGVAPKRAAQLVRFDHAVQRLGAGEDLASVAVECGYVDQSHLHREVLAFSGTTPGYLAGDVGIAVERAAFAAGTFVQDRRVSATPR
ncbi:helix-turn-helix domain-containing protein [Nocardia sp. NPDC050406]|uniref:helix-turn-helix domain-containing protein n=1 Tax=Nocardia sp. NPDC050406 TaxID=3364318 RepID=UPI0037A51D3E